MRTQEDSMPVLAIVGAGPGMGLAIAKTFGANGNKVGLLSRDSAKLHPLVAELAEHGIEAAAFALDVAVARSSRRKPLPKRILGHGLLLDAYNIDVRTLCAKVREDLGARQIPSPRSGRAATPRGWRRSGWKEPGPAGARAGMRRQ
jgi:NAD(P)-dependent dehydrogenase (short-subunit alcohol dehydrogenase family)